MEPADPTGPGDAGKQIFYPSILGKADLRHARAIK